jgi:hypothetical protein
MRLIATGSLVGFGSAALIRLASRVSTAWTYRGCYVDGVGQRTLAYPSYEDYDVADREDFYDVLQRKWGFSQRVEVRYRLTNLVLQCLNGIVLASRV